MSNKSFFLNPEFENLVTDKASLRDDFLSHLHSLANSTKDIANTHEKHLSFSRYVAMIDLFNRFNIENIFTEIINEKFNRYDNDYIDEPYMLSLPIGKDGDICHYDRDFIKSELLPFLKESDEFVNYMIAYHVQSYLNIERKCKEKSQSDLQEIESYFKNYYDNVERNKFESDPNSFLTTAVLKSNGDAMNTWVNHHFENDEYFEKFGKFLTIENLRNLTVDSDAYVAIMGAEVVQDMFLSVIQDILDLFVERYFVDA